ncbi:TPA: ribonucleotide-diphosphate reductase subunit beta [Salmonella enterica]|nr:ribonucleotide-diphosphate reductase subunit beta [Salmonella enterica]HCH9607931.1 ribonucleotide-diphosphate reductase subunit beta [Salmonella enterica]HDI5000225.1 ribonucleotide-diphosphate reductase subunit beta [Salmonella enterica]HDI5005046.1 ribonucleotide-diphosphate reductase subunit beta [Salmonella enterica]
MKLNIEKLNPIYRNIALEKAAIFNENGSDAYEDQLLVGGNPTGIVNLNTVRHQWAATIYNQMLANFWIPQTVDMTDDKRTKDLLTADETQATYDTLSFLIFMDSFQVTNLPNIAEVITSKVVNNCLTSQAFDETIHTLAYQYIAETLLPTISRDDIYNRWKDIEPLKERIRTMTQIAEDYVANPSWDSFYKVLIANLHLEGLYFYQGFNYFDQLAHRKKLVQCAKQIDYIRRQEFTHRGLFINIIKEIGVDEDLIITMTKEAVKNEIKWCHYVYGDRILGISKKSSSAYVMYLANGILKALGIKEIYDVENPYKHLEQAAKQGGTRENFFETTVTSYDTAGSLSGWDMI